MRVMHVEEDDWDFVMRAIKDNVETERVDGYGPYEGMFILLDAGDPIVFKATNAMYTLNADEDDNWSGNEDMFELVVDTIRAED